MVSFKKDSVQHAFLASRGLEDRTDEPLKNQPLKPKTPDSEPLRTKTLNPYNHLNLVAEWIHFTLFGKILPSIKLKVYTFWGL